MPEALLVPSPFRASSSSKLPSLFPERKPVSYIVPVAPSNEADRVAPVALTFEVEPVVTLAVAVWPPEVPPPDGVQLDGVYVTVTLFT